MKFRKIKFDKHPILGNCEFDFTNENGEVVDTIIIAGENGCGKSVFLNALFDFSLEFTKYLKSYEIEVDNAELKSINGVFFGPNNTKGNIIYQEFFFDENDFIHSNININGINVNKLSVLSFNAKRIYSDSEVNFNPDKINYVTAKNIDQDHITQIKSSNSLATDITQLLIDIQILDSSDLADWVNEHKGEIPPEEIQQIRMKRFINAFNSFFEYKKLKGVVNQDNTKIVNFEEFDRTMSIDQLSSGEKQIVFRGGFLLKDKKSTEGAYVLIDEPENSLHPEWQLKILPFIKQLFTNEEGVQTSQIIIATHSPFIIHNSNRNNDKVIVLQKNKHGQIEIEKDPKFYSWTSQQLIEKAFNLNLNFEPNRISVFVEGETDEKYYNKALDIFGYDKSKILFKWIGRKTEKSKNENTGNSGLNNAALFFKSNMQEAKSPVILLYDCDTNKQEEDDRNLHIRKMNKNEENKRYKRGVENLLRLQDNFNYEEYYKEESKIDDYGAISNIFKLDKTYLCNYICSLSDENLKEIFANLKSEIEKLLLIK